MTTQAAPKAASPMEREGKRLGNLMALPAQLLLVFIVVFPLLMQLYVSTTWWSPLDGEPWYMAFESWNWFDNYAYLFQDPRLWSSIWRTLLIVVVCVPAQFFIGMGLAILFMDKFPGKTIFYTILLTPMMVVPAVVGYMFYIMFQQTGPMNDLIAGLTGMNADINWLSDVNLAMVAVMIAEIWQWTPLMFLILLAGLSGVPEDQMRAARLLGASAFQRFWRIALPKMKTVIIICLVLRTVECLKVFDTLFIMTRGGPGVATESVSLFLYKTTFQDLEWSYVASIGLFILVALSVLAGFGIWFMTRGAKPAVEVKAGAEHG
ncbi:MAG: sugar ABC transporter permease [Rhodospirillales bacterium]